jgi:Na+/phosphate symporter
MEQLADSNYYLGFMFTLMSILISLIGTVSNSYDIDTIINNFGVSMITTLMGLLARVYLANFIPTNEANKEMINQSISDKMRMMNEILLDNMQKNKVFSQMIDVRMTILVDSTQEALEQFKKLLDEDFKSSIKTFNDSIKNITVNMENTHKKQTKILSAEYEKVKKKSEEYEEVIDNQKKAISEFGAQIKKSSK